MKRGNQLTRYPRNPAGSDCRSACSGGLGRTCGKGRPREYAQGVYGLVLAGDNNYAQGLAVSLRTALKHLRVPVDVYILDNGLSCDARARLERITLVRWLSVDADRLANLSSDDRLGPAAYARLLAPELVLARRIVYLDADLMVRRDLSGLFTTPLRAPFGAVPDFHVKSTDHEYSGSLRDDPRRYFNTGVLVIDVAAWQAARLTERALAYAAAQPPNRLRFADQDALNAVADDWHELDSRYNVQTFTMHLSRRHVWRDRELWLLYLRAAVLHFVGPNPWEESCETRGRHLWLREAAGAFPDARPAPSRQGI